MIINKKQIEIQNNVSIFPSNIEDSALHLSTFHVNWWAKFTEKVGTCQLPVDLGTCMLCDVHNFVFLFSSFFFTQSVQEIFQTLIKEIENHDQDGNVDKKEDCTIL